MNFHSIRPNNLTPKSLGVENRFYIRRRYYIRLYFEFFYFLFFTFNRHDRLWCRLDASGWIVLTRFIQHDSVVKPYWTCACTDVQICGQIKNIKIKKIAKPPRRVRRARATKAALAVFVLFARRTCPDNESLCQNSAPAFFGCTAALVQEFLVAVCTHFTGERVSTAEICRYRFRLCVDGGRDGVKRKRLLSRGCRKKDRLRLATDAEYFFGRFIFMRSD